MDLFEREQKVLDNAFENLENVKSGKAYNFEDYILLTEEYEKLLKQLRRITKIADKTTENLNASNLDLMNKVQNDALTGIYNRRFVQENLQRVIKSASRHGAMLSVLMVDVDFFKAFNDTYGHNEGDKCLQAVAQALKNSILRPDDFVARYGGEEFVVVLSECDKDGAIHIASRMLENIYNLKIAHSNSTVEKYVTVSIGITTAKANHTHNDENYIKYADIALYKAKQSGRNKYVFVNFEEEGL